MESTEMGISDESTLNTDTALQTDGGENSAVESYLELGKRAKGKGSKSTKIQDMLVYGGVAVVSILIGAFFAFLLRGGPKLLPPLKDCPDAARSQLVTIHRKVLEEHRKLDGDILANACKYDDPVEPSENFKKMYEETVSTTSGAASTHDIKVTRPLAKKAKEAEIDTPEAPANKEQWRFAVAHVEKRAGRLWQNWINNLNNGHSVTMEDIHASDEVGDEARKHMCTQMLAIMQQVHKLKMVHQNLDSENVFLLADGTVTIGNFNAYQMEGQKMIFTNANLSEPSILAATNGNRHSEAEIFVNHKTDIYCLGEVMYKVLFKKNIEFSDGTNDLEGKKLEDAKAEGKQVNVKFPDGYDVKWCKLISKMVDFSKDRRIDWDEINKEFADLLQ